MTTLEHSRDICWYDNGHWQNLGNGDYSFSRESIAHYHTDE
jgi:hypothetical protein